MEIDTDLWSEIQDMPGEIFDIDEIREEFNLDEYINSNIDYWIMNPATYTFSGNAVTYVGAAALFATPLVLYWIFRSFYNSPVNK